MVEARREGLGLKQGHGSRGKEWGQVKDLGAARGWSDQNLETQGPEQRGDALGDWTKRTRV